MGAKLFGTDGVRGVANVYPMTTQFALNLAMACSDLVATSKKKVAIAKDTRISGDMLEAALIAGFTSKGVDVLRLGVIPTPALTLLTPQLDVDMAVMITASHNPYHDNGIKLIAANGDKFSDEITAAIEASVEVGEFSLDKDRIGKVVDDFDVINLYNDMVSKIAEKDSLKGLKIVLDCANGCFSKIMPSVFKNTGAEVVVLSNQPDGYNINKDCGSQHIENMSAKVKQNGADIGIACDGDGDRIIICDENGMRLDGDQIIAFLGQYYKNKGILKSDTVVATILSNPALDRFLQKIGVKCIRAAVGERNVIVEMKNCGSNVGGEESGHMVVSDYSKTGDALVTALVVAKGLKESGKKMSELFPLFSPMLKKRVDSRFDGRENMLSAFENPEFQAAIKTGENEISGKGKLLVRKSGTEPKIQVWVWGDDKTLVEKVNARVSDVLSEFSGFVAQKDVL